MDIVVRLVLHDRVILEDDCADVARVRIGAFVGRIHAQIVGGGVDGLERLPGGDRESAAVDCIRTDGEALGDAYGRAVLDREFAAHVFRERGVRGNRLIRDGTQGKYDCDECGDKRQKRILTYGDAWSGGILA